MKPALFLALVVALSGCTITVIAPPQPRPPAPVVEEDAIPEELPVPVQPTRTPTPEPTPGVLTPVAPPSRSPQPLPSPTPTASPTPMPVPIATPNPWGSDAFIPADGSVVAGEQVTFTIPPIAGAVKYRVHLRRGTTPYDGVAIGEQSAPEPLVTFEGVKDGDYLYQIAAYQADGTTIVSNWIRFQVLLAP